MRPCRTGGGRVIAATDRIVGLPGGRGPRARETGALRREGTLLRGALGCERGLNAQPRRSAGVVQMRAAERHAGRRGGEGAMESGHDSGGDGPYWLAAHVYLGLCDHHAVSMDLRHDRYHAVQRAEALA